MSNQDKLLQDRIDESAIDECARLQVTVSIVASIAIWIGWEHTEAIIALSDNQSVSRHDKVIVLLLQFIQAVEESVLFVTVD